MALTRVRVRRERPTALAWAIALAVTALAFYLLTLPREEEPDSLFASAAVTRQLTFGPIEVWCVTLAERDTPEAARVAAAELTDRGAAGCVARGGKGWQVLGACYDSEPEARRMAARIRASEGLEAGVTALAAGEAALRLTAPEAQLDALSAGDALLRSLHARLGTLAAQLDRGEASPEAVRALCAVAAGEAAGAAKALERAGRGSEVCASLAAALRERARMLGDGFIGDASLPRATLSGRLRCAQIEGLLAHIAWQAARGGRISARELTYSG